MTRTLKFFSLAAALLLALAVVPAAPAQTLNQEVIFHVHKAVALPNVVLMPGNYQVQFINAEDSVVAVSRADGQFVGLYQVRPTDQIRANDKTEVVVRKLANGTPAIQKWFYPGELTGYQFLYPHTGNMMLARARAHKSPVS